MKPSTAPPEAERTSVPVERIVSDPVANGDETRSLSRSAKLGKLIADQAVPLAIGVVSLVIAVDAWLASRPITWEAQRALASIEIQSDAVRTGPGETEAVVTIRVANVGALTFAIMDLHVTIEAVGGLAGAWDENSLLAVEGAALPIGLRPFRLLGAEGAGRAHYQFDDREQTWHVVDPGRSVDVTFVQPTRGSGRLAVFVDVFTQPMKMASLASAITTEQLVNGVVRSSLPEHGTGEVSDMSVFPYSAGHILVVPPDTGP